MKKNMLLALTFATLFGLSSCQPPTPAGNQNTSSSGGGYDNGGGNGNGNGNGSGTGTGTGSGTGSTGSSCSGTSADGQGDGYSLHHFDLLLAGHQPWRPGSYSNSLATQTMPTIQEAKILFQSDSRYKIRFKAHSQPFPTTGQEYCYGRAVGQPADPNTYTKLRLRVKLRNILCDQPDPNNTNNCLSGFYLANPHYSKILEPIAVNGCSPVLDLSALRGVSQYGTVVEVDDVKSDNYCQQNGQYCPAERIVRAASCWNVTMQVSTDYTQDFK